MRSTDTYVELIISPARVTTRHEFALVNDPKGKVRQISYINRSGGEGRSRTLSKLGITDFKNDPWAICFWNGNIFEAIGSDPGLRQEALKRIKRDRKLASRLRVSL